MCPARLMARAELQQCSPAFTALFSFLTLAGTITLASDRPVFIMSGDQLMSYTVQSTVLTEQVME